MIIQRFEPPGSNLGCGGGLIWMVPQSEHARLAGDLARGWDVDLPQDVLAAIDQHDDPWIASDSKPRPDGCGGLYDFMSFPLDERLVLYTEGIDAMADGYTALLTSLHYVWLIEGQATSSWIAHERRRQEVLTASLGVNRDVLVVHLGWLRFFDVLSLYVCMTPPGVSENGRPHWLSPEVFAKDPEGRRFAPRWVGEQHLVLAGAPMKEVAFKLECSGLPLDDSGRVVMGDSLRTRRWRLVVSPDTAS